MKEDHHSYRHDYAVAKKKPENRQAYMGFEPLNSMQYHCSTLLIELVSSTVECCTVIVEVNGLIPEIQA